MPPWGALFNYHKLDILHYICYNEVVASLGGAVINKSNHYRICKATSRSAIYTTVLVAYIALRLAAKHMVSATFKIEPDVPANFEKLKRGDRRDRTI